MGIVDRVARFVTGAADSQKARDILNQAYSATKQRLDLLARHAQDAPNDAATEGLRQLHESENEQANRLLQALTAAGGKPRLLTSTLSLAPAQNHWGRLVQDLELHRDSVRFLQDSSFQLVDDFPELAKLLVELSEEDEGHCEHLRAMIARADPQALD